jgi:hypothetical protein
MVKFVNYLFLILSIGYLIDSFYDPDKIPEFLWFKINIWVARLFWIVVLLSSLFLLLKNTSKNKENSES